MNSIKVINNHQKNIYEAEDLRAAKVLIDGYSNLLDDFKNRKTIKILDIGGGSGYFSKALYDYFKNNNCEITVIDTAQYNTWKAFGNTITFMKVSVNDLTSIFSRHEFDLVFANRVFHHFVLDTWKKTIQGINNIMLQISYILKEDGFFCIADHFFDGLIYDKASSKIIYTITSCTFKPIIKICRKLRVESAGIGVCFLSKKMWLNMLNTAGFQIEEVKESNWSRVNEWYKRLFFLNKENQLDNLIITKLKSTSI